MTETFPKHSQHWRPLSDRWSFKPVALLLLIAVVAASSVVMAVVISPPFLAAGMGVQELQSRLDAGDIRRVGTMQIAARMGRRVEGDQLASRQHAFDQRVALARRAVAPVEPVGSGEPGHRGDPVAKCAARSRRRARIPGCHLSLGAAQTRATGASGPKGPNRGRNYSGPNRWPCRRD